MSDTVTTDPGSRPGSGLEQTRRLGVETTGIEIIEESERTGQPFPEWLRKDEGLGTVEDVAGLVVFLASDASAGVTGQAIGIGGDRLALWSHPAEKAVAFADGGWTAESIAASWQSGVGAEPETYGIPAPKAPAFTVVSDTASADGKLHVALDNPDALGGFSLTVRLIYDGQAKPQFVEADEDGTVALPPGPPPAALVPDLPVFDVALKPYPLKGAARAITFRFEPNDLGVADFRDEPLAVEGNELVLHRYDEAIRFRKGGDR